MPHFELLKFMSLYIQEIFSDKRPQCGVPPHVSLLTKKYVCHQSDGVAVLVDISRQIVIGFWFLSGLGLCSSSQRIASL